MFSLISKPASSKEVMVSGFAIKIFILKIMAKIKVPQIISKHLSLIYQAAAKGLMIFVLEALHRSQKKRSDGLLLNSNYSHQHTIRRTLSFQAQKGLIIQYRQLTFS